MIELSTQDKTDLLELLCTIKFTSPIAGDTIRNPQNGLFDYRAYNNQLTLLTDCIEHYGAFYTSDKDKPFSDLDLSLSAVYINSEKETLTHTLQDGSVLYQIKKNMMLVRVMDYDYFQRMKEIQGSHHSIDNQKSLFDRHEQITLLLPFEFSYFSDYADIALINKNKESFIRPTLMPFFGNTFVLDGDYNRVVAFVVHHRMLARFLLAQNPTMLTTHDIPAFVDSLAYDSIYILQLIKQYYAVPISDLCIERALEGRELIFEAMKKMINKC